MCKATHSTRPSELPAVQPAPKEDRRSCSLVSGAHSTCGKPNAARLLNFLFPALPTMDCQAFALDLFLVVGVHSGGLSSPNTCVLLAQPSVPRHRSPSTHSLSPTPICMSGPLNCSSYSEEVLGPHCRAVRMHTVRPALLTMVSSRSSYKPCLGRRLSLTTCLHQRQKTLQRALKTFPRL